jgi:hypothetical protein
MLRPCGVNCGRPRCSPATRARQPWIPGRSSSRCSAVAQLADDFPEVSELDLNPVVATLQELRLSMSSKLKLQPAEDETDPCTRSLATRRAHRPNP